MTNLNKHKIKNRLCDDDDEQSNYLDGTLHPRLTVHPLSKHSSK